ncbi:MAG: hypothetical protein ACRESQ_02265 [Gammaproteobacteria bacterium]
MRCTMILCGLLAMGIGTAANADAAWTISAQRPCTGLTAGWAKPLAELNKLVGPNWQAAPGPVKGAGLVLLFIASCPDSSYAGKSTGRFSSAFVLVPVEPVVLDASAPMPVNAHWIAVLGVAGISGTPVMNLFQGHGIPVTQARVSLTSRAFAKGKRAAGTIHFRHGTLALGAEWQPVTKPMTSTDTTAVRVSPPGVLFNGPESSTRYAEGKGSNRSTGTTWLTQFALKGDPLFVTLDTDFTWNFAFRPAPHS